MRSGAPAVPTNRVVLLILNIKNGLVELPATFLLVTDPVFLKQQNSKAPC